MILIEHTYPRNTQGGDEGFEETPQSFTSFTIRQSESLSLPGVVDDLTRPLVTIGMEYSNSKCNARYSRVVHELPLVTAPFELASNVI
jgi:hypothetical protein